MSIDDHTALQSARILVVDDDEVARSLIVQILRRAGFSNVVAAADGMEALVAIGNGAADLVILDIVMPRMDGFQVCAELRDRPSTADLPILVQTALSDTADRVRAFTAGATDVVSKPLNPRELVARVSVHLSNRRLLQELQHYRERMSEELDLARTMQRELLPTQRDIEAARRFGIAIQWRFEPSEEVGGDLLTLMPIDDMRLAVFLADVSGHGISAALTTFRLHSMLVPTPPSAADPCAFLSYLNSRLFRSLPAGHFVTGMYLVIDRSAREIRWAGAAFPDAMLIPYTDAAPVPLTGTGLPLGIVEDATHPTQQVAIGPGMRLIAFTDALVETEVDGQVLMAQDEIGALLSDHVGSPFAQVLDTFNRRRASAELSDDLTLVGISMM